MKIQIVGAKTLLIAPDTGLHKAGENSFRRLNKYWEVLAPLIAESICTQYSNLSGRPDIFLGSGTFKKLGTLLFAKSRVQKNRVIVIQRENRPGCLFSFWITMTLVFYTLLFSKSWVPDFFQGHKPTLVFKTRIVGADWLGD